MGIVDAFDQLVSPVSTTLQPLAVMALPLTGLFRIRLKVAPSYLNLAPEQSIRLPLVLSWEVDGMYVRLTLVGHER